MGFVVNLFQFNKRENSTLVPETIDTGHVTASQQFADCVMRSGCSILDPVIGFTAPTGKTSQYNPSDFNYAGIDSFGGRFYWITDWTWEQGVWWATMTVDVLASYKNEIGSSTQYILRSSHTYDGNITDNMYPATSQINTVYVGNSYTGSSKGDSISTLTGYYNSGYFVLGVVNARQTSYGGITYYRLTYNEMQTVNVALLANPTYAGISTDTIEEGLQKVLVNPYQYINSCTWYPFAVPTQSGGGIPLWVGWYQITASTDTYDIIPLAANEPLYAEYVIPKHPQVSRGKYLNRPPYSTYTLYIPAFGEITLPSEYVGQYAGNTMSVYINVDLISGMAMLTVILGGKQIVHAQTQFGVPVAISTITRDTTTQSSILTALSGAAQWIGENTTWDWLKGQANSLGAAADKVAASNTHTDSKGSNGNTSVYHYPSYLAVQNVYVVDDDNADLGRPLCKDGKLSSYPGYLTISTPDISIHCTQAEQQKIKSYMTGGFFYE